MRIPLEKFGNFQIKDREYLSDSIVKFRYKDQIKPGKLYEMILNDDENTEQLFPGAPNREAVEYNFIQSKKGFERSFQGYKDTSAIKDGIIKDFKDLLKLNLKHVFNPYYIYTNGQKIVTLFNNNETYEIVSHKSVFSFFDFFHEYNRDISLELNNLIYFTDHTRAEDYIKTLLASLNFTRLIVFKGISEKELLIQPCLGSANIIHFDGKEFYQDIIYKASGSKEPYTILNNLSKYLKGYSVKTCATCKNFRFSGMTRDMSGGSKGYCLKNVSKLNDLKEVVSVFHLCNDYKFRNWFFRFFNSSFL